MGLEDLFKLEKLQISAFNDRERKSSAGAFTVMFNPESFAMKHQNVFQDDQGVGGAQRFAHVAPENLSLELLIDGTGVSDYGIATLLGLGQKSVSEQVKEFLQLCFYKEGEIHEPRYLRIQWGEWPLTGFDCRLQSVDISYTSFDRNGAPLRAKLNAAFVQDSVRDPVRNPESKSPDLSHTRTVKHGDTLPLLCAEIYGSSKHYMRVAQVNDLDDFRNLAPGQELIFPPFERGRKN